MRGRIPSALAALVAAALLLLPQAAAQAQPQPTRCPAITGGALPDLAPGTAEIRQIVRPAPLLAESATASILVRKQPELEINSFKVLIRDLRTGGMELLPVEEVRGQVHEDTAADLKITERGDWYHLVVEGPSASGISTELRRKQRLMLFACDGDGEVVAYGGLIVTRTASGTAKLLAALVVLLLYFAWVTVVWSSRNRLSEEKELPPPQRWEPVKPFSWLRCCDPVVLTADLFDRGSLSKLQILVFTLVVVYHLAEILLRTGVLTDISPTVVYLLGIPAIGSIGTQVTTRSRDRLSSSNWAWLASRGILPVNDPGSGPPRWTDLFMSDGELNLYKVQAAAFSLLVAVSMLQTGMSGFREFSVPESLLHILALSQAIFVGGNFTKPATMGDLDNLIDELKAREQTLRLAAHSGIDVAPDGSPQSTPPAPAPAAPFDSLTAARDPAAVPNAARRYEEVAEEVSLLLESLTHRAARSELLFQRKI